MPPKPTAWKSRTALLGSQTPPVIRLVYDQGWITQPLRSVCFRRLHHYYGLLRPSARIGTLSLVGPPLGFLPLHRAAGFHVPHESLGHVHAASMPDATRAVSRLPSGLSRSNACPPVLTPFLRFRHVISGSLAFVFVVLT